MRGERAQSDQQWARPEYRRLAGDLPGLAREFDCPLPPAVETAIADLTLAMECVDRLLDEIPSAAQRQPFGRAVLAALREDAGAERALPPELAFALLRLRTVIDQDATKSAFLELVEHELEVTERMRTTHQIETYLECVELEGRLTVEMALHLVGRHGNRRLVAFLRSIAELGNLFDKLADARSDYRRGELLIRPGLRFHARLLSRLVYRLPAAMARYPRPSRFVWWGLGYVSVLPGWAAWTRPLRVLRR